MKQKSPAIIAAQNFIDLVYADEAPSDATLLASLDALLHAYHSTPEVEFDRNAPEVPDRHYENYQIVLSEIKPRFPNYGYYPVADPTSLEDPDKMENFADTSVADALDDIVDIISEMKVTLWYADNVNADQALWHFRTFYFHWGKHARELSYYLFMRREG